MNNVSVKNNTLWFFNWIDELIIIVFFILKLCSTSTLKGLNTIGMHE